MSSSNYCFLTCIQISQEAGKVLFYSRLVKNFPQFVVIHTVEGFSLVNKAVIDVFLELSCFFDDQTDVGNLISGSSAFTKSSLNIWKFSVHILLNPALENFEHYFTNVCFPLFLCTDHWGRLPYLSLLFFGTLHLNGCIFAFLLCLLLHFFSPLFVRPPQTAVLLFCISFSGGCSWSLSPIQCHEPLSMVLQALCLSDLIPWIYLSLPLYNCEGCDLGHTWMV